MLHIATMMGDQQPDFSKKGNQQPRWSSVFTPENPRRLKSVLVPNVKPISSNSRRNLFLASSNFASNYIITVYIVYTANVKV